MADNQHRHQQGTHHLAWEAWPGSQNSIISEVYGRKFVPSHKLVSSFCLITNFLSNIHWNTHSHWVGHRMHSHTWCRQCTSRHPSNAGRQPCQRLKISSKGGKNDSSGREEIKLLQVRKGTAANTQLHPEGQAHSSSQPQRQASQA